MKDEKTTLRVSLSLIKFLIIRIEMLFNKMINKLNANIRFIIPYP